MFINKIYLQLFSNGDVDRKLGDMATKVALQNFDPRYATLLFFNSTLYYGVDLFLHVFTYNIIINKSIINFKLPKIRQYVIFGNDATDLEQLLDILGDFGMKNTGKFVIVCQSQVSNDCDETELTKLFWEYRIVNVVLIKTTKKEAHGYTYFPISDGDCHNIKPVNIYSSNCSHITTNHSNIFGMKLKNLSLCPLFVSTFIQRPYMNFTNGTPEGADGDLLRIIAYGLNASLRIMTPHSGTGWGFRQDNGTWAGSLADLYNDFANISMTSAALTLTRFSDFQMSRSYYTVHIVWIAHPATLENEALKLLRPFEQSTRIALVVSYMLVILFAFGVKTDKWLPICRKIQEDQQSKSIVFYSWMICMGQSVTKLPTKFVLLYVTLLWIYYCFIIRTVYQVHLISSLKGIFFENQFKTLEDAMRANYSFGGGKALQDYYIDYPAVYNNWVNVDTPEMIPTILNISKGEKFLLAMNSDTAKLAIKKYKINLHILPQKIVSSPTVIFFKKFSPLSEPINLILSRLIATGFPEMLHKYHTNVKNVYKSNENDEALTIVHFTACYVVLILGWAFSSVFFLLEVFFGKVYKHPILAVTDQIK